MRPLIILTILSLMIGSCSLANNKNINNNMGFFDNLIGKKDSINKIDNKTSNIEKTSLDSIEYQEKLLATKQFYPFERWRESYSLGLTQYTKQNCDKTKKVFDDLITSLIDLGENASEEQKIELFKIAILKLNKLNDEIEGLIETDEREDLCKLTDKITIACGLDPHKYGDRMAGDGLADEWRDW